MIKLIIFSCLFVSLFHQGLSLNQENVGQHLRFKRSSKNFGSGQSSAQSSASADSSSFVSSGTEDKTESSVGSKSPLNILGLTLGQLSSMIDRKGAEPALTSVIAQLQGLLKTMKKTTDEAVEKLINGDLSTTKGMKLLTSTGSELSKILTNQASSASSASSSSSSSSVTG